MPVNDSENKKDSTISVQPLVFGFVVLIAAALIIIPLLPTLSTNLIYSFSGNKPKIYWYLSRSGGFVTLSVLWVSMALGLSITNKMARLWPGAPTAFAVHQSASLLGLAFAAYHGLVLMGDHFVDFSLPHLIIPFAIAYKTFWVGLGQICFYLWLIVILSFYVRQWIGQKTWRLIHYVNFGTYALGFLHGVASGTDSSTGWAQWYFWISGTSLMALLGHRLYESFLKNKLTLPQFGFKKRLMASSAFVQANMQASLSAQLRKLPQALVREQSKQPIAATTPVTSVSVPAPQTLQEASNAPSGMKTTPPASPQEAPRLEPAPALTTHLTKDTSQPNVEYIRTGKINVRIFKEPTTRPIPELQRKLNAKKAELQTAFIRIKQSLHAMPVEPTTPNRQRVALSDK